MTKIFIALGYINFDTNVVRNFYLFISKKIFFVFVPDFYYRPVLLYTYITFVFKEILY